MRLIFEMSYNIYCRKRMWVVSGLAVVGMSIRVYWVEAREDQSWSSQAPTQGLCGEWSSVSVYWTAWQ